MATNVYLNRTALTANTAAAVAVASSDKGLYCHVRLVNQGAQPAKVRLFIDDANTPSAADYIEYDAILRPGEPLTHGPLIVPANFSVYARSDSASCNVVAMGEHEIL